MKRRLMYRQLQRDAGQSQTLKLAAMLRARSELTPHTCTALTSHPPGVAAFEVPGQVAARYRRKQLVISHSPWPIKISAASIDELGVQDVLARREQPVAALLAAARGDWLRAHRDQSTDLHHHMQTVSQAQQSAL